MNARLVLPWLLLALLWPDMSAQGTPRTLTADELKQMRERIAGNRTKVEQAARAAQANQQAVSQQAVAMSQAAAYDDADAFVDEAPPAPAPMGFAEILAHGVGAFQEELAKGAAQKAAMDANLARIRAEAEAVDRERQRQQRAQEAAQRQAQLALQQRQLQATPLASSASTAVATSHAREAQLRADVAAERQRLASEQQARTVEADRQARVASQQSASRAAEQQRASVAAEATEAKRQAEAARMQGLQQAEQALRTGFSGSATTCIGGGKDVLYLQTSRPARTGCRVRFEARCPGTPTGAGAVFSQANYIGGSCMGIGDNIRIGTMACAASTVQVTMTQADCGAGG